MNNAPSKFYIAFSAGVTLLLGGVLAYFLHTNIHKLPLQQNFSAEHTSAVWDWTNPMARQQDDLEEVADLMRSRQINTVYSDISVYNDIAQIQDEAQRAIELKKLEDGITKYIATMNAREIRVLASAGNTDWSMPQNRRIPLAIQQFVHEYNETNETKFAGVEFDIESYNQKGFEAASMTEKSLVLMEFLDTVDEVADRHETYVKQSGDKDFELGFAIPYWLDNQNGNIQSVSWKDKTGPTLFHVMDRLNELPRSNVVVMAYRDAASGNDGMIFHSRTEIDYAVSRASNVDVIIGLEVTDVEPEKITFYDKSHTEMINEVKLVYDEFDKMSVFGGTAINDLEGYRSFE